MTQVLYQIEMKGGVVELLATPALFDIARKRGMAIEADADNAAEVFSAYTKLIYLAAINAWDVRRYDDAAMGDFPYKLMDFVEWSSSNAEEFVEVVNFVLFALTGKDLKDYATEQAKGSENESKTANQADEEVKKKSVLKWIMHLFGRSS